MTHILLLEFKVVAWYKLYRTTRYRAVIYKDVDYSALQVSVRHCYRPERTISCHNHPWQRCIFIVLIHRCNGKNVIATWRFWQKNANNTIKIIRIACSKWFDLSTLVVDEIMNVVIMSRHIEWKNLMKFAHGMLGLLVSRYSNSTSLEPKWWSSETCIGWLKCLWNGRKTHYVMFAVISCTHTVQNSPYQCPCFLAIP